MKTKMFEPNNVNWLKRPYGKLSLTTNKILDIDLAITNLEIIPEIETIPREPKMITSYTNDPKFAK